MLKGFKCVTGTPQGKAQSCPRIWSCFSLFSHLIGPIQFSILFLTLQSARQITGLLSEPLVSFWFWNSYPLGEYFRGKSCSKRIEWHFRSAIKAKIFIQCLCFLLFHFLILFRNVCIFFKCYSCFSSKILFPLQLQLHVFWARDCLKVVRLLIQSCWYFHNFWTIKIATSFGSN